MPTTPPATPTQDGTPTPTGDGATASGLMDLRTFVILVSSVTAAALAALPVGITASQHYSTEPIAAGLIAGGAAFATTLLATAASLNSLISKS